MCGIAGFVDFKGRSDPAILKAMADALIHRGPDDAGYEFFRDSDVAVGLGFRRLAIIDLSQTGHQPMTNAETGDWIVFNGEIYNFKEIRKELEELNYTFRSSSDTEVILKSYQQWGLKCIDRFIGMFAIVIYDQKRRKIIGIRDRAGVKPFYYYFDNNVFLFASELKALHKHPDFKKKINNDSIGYFFQHGYISSPSTIFENTFQLPPGCNLELNFEEGKIKITKYWDLIEIFNRQSLDLSYNEVLEETERLCVSSFNYRMVSDVPVGVFLSGGYDSSCVAALLQKQSTGKIRTYTIGFEEKGFNEAPFAKRVAEFIGSEHHEYYCTFNDAIEFVPKLADIYDQPFGDSSAIPTTLVSSIARKHVTVALSADGADELFAGYPRHLKSQSYIRKFNLIPGPLKRIASSFLFPKASSLVHPDRIDKLKRILKSDFESEIFDIINQTYSYGELNRLMNVDFSQKITPFTDSFRLNGSVDVLNKILAVDYNTYLVDDILQKVDRASMSVSLEAREPFIDHRLVEFISTIPSSYKVNGKIQKRILKDIVHKYIPREIMERPKMGFGIPLKLWCRKELKDLFMEHLSDQALTESGFFNTRNVIELREAFLKDQLVNFERIWFVFVFQMWAKRWL